MAGKYAYELSVVVPVFNEKESLSELYGQIDGTVSGKYNCEIIFIDDGSTDGGLEILADIARKDKRVKVIVLRRNFGQTAALAAGFEHSKGEIIVPLDADGQNDPADIPKLIDKLNKGFDIISGWRRVRKDKTLTRKLPSKVANWLIGKITGVKLHDFGCTLKAYRASSLEQIRLYGEMHRFIPALASWSGEKVGEIEVNHRPRTSGETKYGLMRTFKVLLDLITIKFLGSYSTKPIYIFGGLGGVSMAGAIVCGFAVLYQKFIHSSHLSMNRNPLLHLTVFLIMAAIQLVLMGLLAEMLVRTYHESQGRPIYMVAKVIECEGSSENSDES